MNEPEPIIIHNLFTLPTRAGFWMPGSWEESIRYRRKCIQRIGLAYINEEFAGYFVTYDSPMFMLKTPLWGEVNLQECYMEEYYKCPHVNCACHIAPVIPDAQYTQHELRIVSKTNDTHVAEPILHFDLDIWPVKYIKCKCGKRANMLYHIGEKKTGFYCYECSKT